ncbi:MAG: M23 family metallopeptidase [Arcanobacterium sp.]|nr:M23 family metallopeptidase [Arcanobacterium sp.]MDY5588357.1 M23 family metallopeptidase [Arcanobacterium sp.]
MKRVPLIALFASAAVVCAYAAAPLGFPLLSAETPTAAHLGIAINIRTIPHWLNADFALSAHTAPAQRVNIWLSPRETAYSWPTGSPARVLRGYSPGIHNWNSGHRGVDLAARYGAPVYAAASGTVLFAHTLIDRGVVSILDDRGIRTTYEPVQPTVHPGEHVQRGTVIGTVAGYHCGISIACVHWGAKRGRAGYLNPLWLLSPPRVRLIE